MDASFKKKVIADIIYWRGKQRKLHSKRYTEGPGGWVGGGVVLSVRKCVGNVRNNCNFEFRFVSIYET